jgi:hypothetical protein
VARRVLARSVFALAALAALAAGSGLGVPPHEETAGAGLFHAHVLGAYRFGFLLSPAGPSMSAEMSRLHEVLMQAGVPMVVLAQMPGMTRPAPAGAFPTIRSAGLSPIQDLAIELALLVVLVPRLARPRLRPLAELAVPRLPADLWAVRPALAPPRPSLLSI